MERRPDYNNDERITASNTISAAKVIYYRFFAILYRTCGWCVTTTMVNSTWTRNHICDMWGKCAADTHLVYPPCGALESSGSTNSRQRMVVSVGQFRPEKDHKLQIDALTILTKRDRRFQVGPTRMSPVITTLILTQVSITITITITITMTMTTRTCDC